jgi:ubiquinone/menaquinone biosynthesis C-methylase UbiE
MRQVNRNHYAFASYESEERFTSYYHQVQAVLRLDPKLVLEIGVGSGTFTALMKSLNIDTFTIDIDSDLDPSACGSILQLPFRDNSVDVCTAFQVLEHLPFECLRPALMELGRVSRKGVVISLPEFGNTAFVATIPFIRKLRFAGRALTFWYPKHRFDGEHYWEINKRGFRLRAVTAEMACNGLTLRDTWLNPYNPYHRFFVLQKDARRSAGEI